MGSFSIHANRPRGFNSPPPTPPPTTETILMGVAGDSIPGGSTNYFPYINRGSPNGGYAVFNRGRPGQYSQTIDANFDADIIEAAIKPDWVTLNCGTNDRGGGDQTIQVGGGNIGNAIYHGRAMIGRALAAGIKVVVCSINHLADGNLKANTDFINTARKADIDTGVFAGAKAAGQIVYVDMTPFMSDLSTGIALSADLYADNTHPSDKGSRAMNTAYNAALIAAGVISSADYPMTRNQSLSDPTNVFGGAEGTFQGAPSDGIAPGWAANSDGLAVPSIVPAPIGKGSIGNAQRLTILPGASDAQVGGKYVQRQFAVTPGHRVLFTARSYGEGGFAAGTAKARLSLLTAGYLTLYPTNAFGTIPAGEMDGDAFHAVEYLVPDDVTGLILILASGGNTGTTVATIDFYDIKVVDLGQG